MGVDGRGQRLQSRLRLRGCPAQPVGPVSRGQKQVSEKYTALVPQTGRHTQRTPRFPLSPPAGSPLLACSCRLARGRCPLGSMFPGRVALTQVLAALNLLGSLKFGGKPWNPYPQRFTYAYVPVHTHTRARTHTFTCNFMNFLRLGDVLGPQVKQHHPAAVAADAPALLNVEIFIVNSSSLVLLIVINSLIFTYNLWLGSMFTSVISF